MVDESSYGNNDIDRSFSDLILGYYTLGLRPSHDPAQKRGSCIIMKPNIYLGFAAVSAPIQVTSPHSPRGVSCVGGVWK